MSDEDCLRPEGGDEGGLGGCAAAVPSTIPSLGDGPPPPHAGEERRRYAPFTRFTAALAREICTRVAAGESQTEICAEERMPTINTLRRWAIRRGAFGRALGLARAMGGREGTGPVSGYNAAIAHEIVARISEGETLTSIGNDPAMPSGRTILLWRRLHPEFGDEVRLAREVVGERFSDLGWKLAMEATPETAYLTHVRLSQLRWTAALMAPASHGKLKPMEPDAPPPPRPTQTILLRHFDLEIHPETGQQRVVGYCADPGSMLPERDHEGEWTDPPTTIHPRYVNGKPSDLPRRMAVLPPDPDDPEGWC